MVFKMFLIYDLNVLLEYILKVLIVFTVFQRNKFKTVFFYLFKKEFVSTVQAVVQHNNALIILNIIMFNTIRP